MAKIAAHKLVVQLVSFVVIVSEVGKCANSVLFCPAMEILLYREHKQLSLNVCVIISFSFQF